MAEHQGFAPRAPDFKIKVKEKNVDSKDSADAGVAWWGTNGSISIKLRPGISLRWNDGLMITLFPTDHKE